MFDVLRERRFRHSALLLALLPVLATAQSEPSASTPGTVLEYDSATAGYDSSGLSDGSGVVGAGDSPVPAVPIPESMVGEPTAEGTNAEGTNAEGTNAEGMNASAPGGAKGNPMPDTGEAMPASTGAEPGLGTAQPSASGVAAVPAPVEKLQESTAAVRTGKPPTEAPEESGPRFEYESAFDAYSAFEESEGPDWVGSNRRVGEIGGWKTYAREMYETAADGDEPMGNASGDEASDNEAGR